MPRPAFAASLPSLHPSNARRFCRWAPAQTWDPKTSATWDLPNPVSSDFFLGRFSRFYVFLCLNYFLALTHEFLENQIYFSKRAVILMTGATKALHEGARLLCIWGRLGELVRICLGQDVFPVRVFNAKKQGRTTTDQNRS